MAIPPIIRLYKPTFRCRIILIEYLSEAYAAASSPLPFQNLSQIYLQTSCTPKLKKNRITFTRSTVRNPNRTNTARIKTLWLAAPLIHKRTTLLLNYDPSDKILFLYGHHVIIPTASKVSHNWRSHGTANISKSTLRLITINHHKNGRKTKVNTETRMNATFLMIFVLFVPCSLFL